MCPSSLAPSSVESPPSREEPSISSLLLPVEVVEVVMVTMVSVTEVEGSTTSWPVEMVRPSSELRLGFIPESSSCCISMVIWLTELGFTMAA